MPIPVREGLFRYLRPYWRRLALVLALSLISTALSLAVPYLTKDLIDRALLGRDSSDLFRLVGLFVGATVAGFALNVVAGLAYTRTSAAVLFDMRLAVYRHLQRLSPRFYARTRLGDIVSRLNQDIGEIQRIAAEVALAWVGNVLFLAGSVAMMIWLDVRLFLLTLAVLPVSLWALSRYRARLAERVAAMRQASSDVGSFLIETLLGMKVVVGANAQEREVRRFGDRNRRFVGALMAMQRMTYLSGGLPALILTIGTALVFVDGGRRVIDGTLTLGTFVAFLGYQMRLMSPLQSLMGLYASLATVRVSIERVHHLLDARPEVEEAPDAIALDVVRGDVAFEHVSVAFDRGTPVLENVSFEAHAGESLAIVGPSGSGKSTIADLLLRLLDPDAGVVRVDGHDLRTLRLEDVRRHVGLVDQEPFLFHASILDNIRYASPDASSEDLAASVRAAGLDAFIATLPERLDTIVGERGLSLSAGERQRIAVARALLARPSILVLDEPTAALDPSTEHAMVTGYEELRRGRTTIVISHRADVASRADRAVVLDGARIVEAGSPPELLQREGAFANLFGRQHSRSGRESDHES